MQLVRTLATRIAELLDPALCLSDAARADQRCRRCRVSRCRWPLGKCTRRRPTSKRKRGIPKRPVRTATRVAPRFRGSPTHCRNTSRCERFSCPRPLSRGFPIRTRSRSPVICWKKTQPGSGAHCRQSTASRYFPPRRLRTSCEERDPFHTQTLKM